MTHDLSFCSTKGQNEIADEFEAGPAARHRRKDLDKIGNQAFVEPSHSFIHEYFAYRISDAFVLVAHATHGGDLKSSSQDVT